MIPNGLYAVTFGSNLGAGGSGVAAVTDDLVQGGDAGYYYYGTAKEVGSEIEVNLEIGRHQPGHVSVFGDVERFRLIVRGTPVGDQFQLRGQIEGQPQAELVATLKKLK